MARAEALGMLTDEYVYIYYRNLMATETDVLAPWDAPGMHNGRKDLFYSTKQVVQISCICYCNVVAISDIGQFTN